MNYNELLAMKRGTDAKMNTSHQEHKRSPEVLISSPRSSIRTTIKFCRTHIGGPGRITTFIGPAGGGKTEVVQACVASHLNSHVDTFNFEIIGQDQRPMLWGDTERTQDEILDGFDRIKRRIVLENNPNLIVNDRFANIHCHSLIGYSHPGDKLKELEILCSELKPFIILLDGAADLVADINDPKECIPVIGKLIALANEYQASLFVTIHPNPGVSNDHKPRGVFGSELIRKSESVLLLKRAPDDRDVRIITTDFMHGKNRSASDNLETYIKWSDTHRMFVTCDYAPSKRSATADKQADAFADILEGRELRYSELLSELQTRGYCNSIPTGKRWIQQGTDKELITVKNELYKYHINGIT